MSDVRGLLAEAAAILQGDEARADAEALLAHVLGRDKAWLFTWPEAEPSAQQCSRFRQLIAARLEGEPVAYLLGRRGFWSLDLAVTPAVLIPRPETELLVELALARAPLDARYAIADLGTGSGAIALALASERANAHVLATDASADALAVARANAQRLGITNVEFALGDWCAALGDQRFDLIVSNPPYIAADDPHLGEGDLRREPLTALASGIDGLDAIRRIVAETPHHLQPGGFLLLEHGWEQGPAVREVLWGHGFVEVESASDLEARERVSLGRRPV